ERLKTSSSTLQQGEQKERAYYRRVEIRDMLDQKFKTDPHFDAHAAGWDEYLRFRIDDIDVANDRSARQLRWAIEVARRTIAVVRATLSEQGLAPLAPEEAARHTVARHVGQLSAELERGRNEFGHDE